MSATNRGDAAAERPEDMSAAENYPTPKWCVDRLLDAVELPRKSWVEPCCGDGAIIRAVRNRSDIRSFVATDIRDVGRSALDAGADVFAQADATSYTYGDCGVAITNPPFSLAEPIIRNMLSFADYAIILTRQGFVGHSRAEWMRDDMPDTYELPERPSFVSKESCTSKCGWKGRLAPHGQLPFGCPQCGGVTRVRRATDAADYCWLVWTPDRNRKEGKRVILASTPLAKRNAE